VTQKFPRNEARKVGRRATVVTVYLSLLEYEGKAEG
jgi:hypothetical protein